MNRRQLIKAAAWVPLAAALPAVAAGLSTVPYSRETYEQALASGEPFILDFFAPW